MDLLLSNKSEHHQKLAKLVGFYPVIACIVQYMEVYSDIWKCMRVHGSICEYMQLYGSTGGGRGAGGERTNTTQDGLLISLCIE